MAKGIKYRDKLDPILLKNLDKLEKALGSEVWVTSDYRSPAYNKKVGGAKKSQHMYGKAVDITRNSFKQSPEEFEQIARSVGFRGIGFYDTFVHADVRDYDAKWDNRTGTGKFDKKVSIKKENSTKNELLKEVEKKVETLNTKELKEYAMIGLGAVLLGKILL